jgi:putative transcriptional regulator
MPGKDQETITNRIRRLRFDNGEMTQQELAERVGVTRQTIIALEAGKYVPSLLLAFRLAAAFGVRVEEVFQFEDGSPDRSVTACSVPVQDEVQP